MKPKDQITALAELDGWKQKLFDPPYLTSLDAIVPLIVKWCGDNQARWDDFTQKIRTSYCRPPSVEELLRLSPSRLSKALLQAAGKWRDE